MQRHLIYPKCECEVHNYRSLALRSNREDLVRQAGSVMKERVVVTRISRMGRSIFAMQIAVKKLSIRVRGRRDEWRRDYLGWRV